MLSFTEFIIHLYAKSVFLMTKRKSIHPTEQEDLRIKERGILVLDNVRSMPVYNKPLIYPNVVIGLNLCGRVEVEYDMQKVEFCTHDISVVFPNHIINAKESSDDYRAMLLVISAEYFEQIKRLYPIGYQESLHFHWNAHFHLTDEQFRNILDFFKLIRSVSYSDNPRRLYMLNQLLEVMLMLMHEYRQKNGITSSTESPQNLLFAKFYDAITLHYAESHQVDFYASLFNLTPKHFSTVIKKQTGIPAHAWISEYIATQAKFLLRNKRQLTIQQISIRLGFTDQASFSRFFKKSTNISPTEYRDSEL